MKRSYLYYVPAVCLMCLIFYFSAMPEDISGEQSREVSFSLQTFVRFVFGNREEISPEDEQTVLPVRKLAHVVEYGLLMLLLYPAMAKNKIPHALTCGIFTTILYAVTDEVHQLFVQGRSGEVQDIMIDSLGAVIGACLIFFYRKIRKEIPKVQKVHL